jgi:predicted O-methyltransferase YrrM
MLVDLGGGPVDHRLGRPERGRLGLDAGDQVSIRTRKRDTDLSPTKVDSSKHSAFRVTGMTRQPGLPAYGAADLFPARVWEAVELSRSHGFPLACLPEVGRLLRLCAGLRGIERACELGTAFGVGAAWIESGLRPGATLLTIELDAERAAAAHVLFATSDSVEVVAGDWSVALGHGPFDLLFSDGGPKRAPGDPEKLRPLVRPGGLVVLDDYTPDYPDPKDISRLIWLDSPSYRAQEIMVSREASVIVAVRTG